MLPKINDILYFQVDSLDEDESKMEYRSRIADITNDYIAMEIPLSVNNGKLKRLYAGDRLSVYFVSEGGIKNYFSTEVLGFKEDQIHQVVIRLPEPESIGKVQRRNFLRVPAELEVALKTSKQIQFLARTVDLGGGGISFHCGKDIFMGVQEQISGWILIHYKNGTADHAHFIGEVVRLKDLENGYRLVMLRFTDIKNNEQQKIVKYCFERQLEMRK